MAKPKKTALKRLIDAFTYSVNGIKSAYDSEVAFRQEAVAAALLIPLALIMNLDLISKVLLISSIMLVLIVEMVNTAIEALADKASTKKDALVGKAKDCGSGAVLISIINAIIIWILVLFF